MDEKEQRETEPRKPSRPIPGRHNLMEQIDQFFRQDSFGGLLKSIDDFFEQHAKFAGGFPARLFETKDRWVIEAELPGVKREDIHIELLGNRIRISVENDVEINAQNEKKSTYTHERRIDRAERMFTLPYTIDRSRTHATFSNGLLKISGPKYPNTQNTLAIE